MARKPGTRCILVPGEWGTVWEPAQKTAKVCRVSVNSVADRIYGANEMQPAQRSFGKLFDLSGRVVLITGAGCDIAATDVNLEAVKRTAAKVSERGRRSIAIRADVGSPDAIKAMVDTTVGELGTIDILVNSAGISHHESAVDLPV